ncbi:MULTISPECIES: Holliday junction branch migration protein RuvA [unclassified Moraxella]|uniref:Holliday junction branch migration protein RuvA n=1 Tax=unclassified Moraxella TaxID=2685852 RepID=UPI003AF5F411
MIGQIHGTVAHLLAPTAIIMTTSGVGYEIELPLNAFCQLQLNQPTTLWTQLIVREDAHLLFGFLSHQERELFRQLLKVNGVGAKMALAMMSTLTLNELKRHVINGDENALTRIPGVGKKTAQRLIVELADKLKDLGGSADTLINEGQSSLTMPTDSSNEVVVIAEVEAGLMALGYRDKEAQSAIKIAKNNLGNEVLTTQNLLKLALKSLAI